MMNIVHHVEVPRCSSMFKSEQTLHVPIWNFPNSSIVKNLPTVRRKLLLNGDDGALVAVLDTPVPVPDGQDGAVLSSNLGVVSQQDTEGEDLQMGIVIFHQEEHSSHYEGNVRPG